MSIIIDAYNYMYARGGLEKLLPFDDFAAARAEMLEFLEELRKAVRRRVVVVVDGSRPAGPEGRGCGGLEVVYADGEADSMIEYLVAESHSKKQMLVVTSDRAVQRAVKDLGVDVVGAGEFHREAARLVRRKRSRKPDPRHKFHPPEEQDVDFWIGRFDQAPDTAAEHQAADLREAERLADTTARPTPGETGHKGPSLLDGPVKRTTKRRARRRKNATPPETTKPTQPSDDDVDYWLERFSGEHPKED